MIGIFIKSFKWLQKFFSLTLKNPLTGSEISWFLRLLSLPLQKKFLSPFKGFGKSLDIHRKLVRLVQNEIGDLMVAPSNGWDVRFDQIWQSRTNIIVAYDNTAVVNEFSSLLFLAVQQRWGNCQSLSDLKRFLTPTGFSYPM